MDKSLKVGSSVIGSVQHLSLRWKKYVDFYIEIKQWMWPYCVSIIRYVCKINRQTSTFFIKDDSAVSISPPLCTTLISIVIPYWISQPEADLYSLITRPFGTHVISFSSSELTNALLIKWNHFYRTHLMLGSVDSFLLNFQLNAVDLWVSIYVNDP